MFSSALWVAEQEAKILAPYYYGERKQYSELSKPEQLFFISAGMVNVSALALFGASPYTRLIAKRGQSLSYLADLAMEARYIRTGDVAFKPAYASRGFATSAPFAFKKLATRKLAAKVGARFIPYVGWALFAYDMWKVGTWVGEKINLVDTYRSDS